jgi:hypothetical protein
MKTGSTQSRFREFQETTTTNEEKMETSSEETIKQRTIALSLKYNILSPHTAFVGIEKRSNVNNADMVLREVPIQISAGGGRGGSGRGLGFGGAARHRKVMANNVGGRIVTRSMATSSLSPYANQLLESQRESRRRPHKSAVRKRKNTSLDYNSSDHEDQILPNSWPSNDQDIVRHLINEQKFDGLWNLDSQAVKNLTGKILADFLSGNKQVDHQVLISAIIIAVLETRFATLTTMWHGVVYKARKRLTDLLGTDSKNLDQLLENVRKQL